VCKRTDYAVVQMTALLLLLLTVLRRAALVLLLSAQERRCAWVLLCPVACTSTPVTATSVFCQINYVQYATERVHIITYILQRHQSCKRDRAH
jgi:putative effector of murein hydrolase